jgi:hypothetical protein
MNKEKYNQIIDEVYKNYFLIKSMEKGPFGISGLILPKEEFINNCKTNPEFSEKWGLKIEERKLSLEERRHQLALPIWRKVWPIADMMVPTNVDNTPFKIPTKLITLTYNNETIESYE